VRSPEELQDLIHEVVPGLPLPALELLEELGAIGEEAALAQELAHTVALVRRSTTEPTLSDDFTDSLMAALPAGPPPSAQAAAPEAEAAPVEGVPAAGASGRSPWAGFAASFLLGLGLSAAWGPWGTIAERPAPATPAPAGSEVQGEPEVAPQAPLRRAQEAPSEELPREVPSEVTPEGDLGPGVVEAGQDSQPAPVAATPVDPALVRLASRGDPVQSYVARASIVFEALERLDPEDPRVSRALALHLERTELLEQGERLLVAIEYDPSGRRLRPLIRGAQVVLRKVRHVPRPSQPESGVGSLLTLSAIRQEVRHTGLLAACRELLASEAPQNATPEEAGETRDL
jgi:hypothetical protein